MLNRLIRVLKGYVKLFRDRYALKARLAEQQRVLHNTLQLPSHCSPTQACLRLGKTVPWSRVGRAAMNVHKWFFMNTAMLLLAAPLYMIIMQTSLTHTPRTPSRSLSTPPAPSIENQTPPPPTAPQPPTHTPIFVPCTAESCLTHAHSFPSAWCESLHHHRLQLVYVTCTPLPAHTPTPLPCYATHVQLDCKEVRPPVQKEMAMLLYARENVGGVMVKADTDVMFTPERLRGVLDGLDAERRDLYVGRPLSSCDCSGPGDGGGGGAIASGTDGDGNKSGRGEGGSGSTASTTPPNKPTTPPPPQKPPAVCLYDRAIHYCSGLLYITNGETLRARDAGLFVPMVNGTSDNAGMCRSSDLAVGRVMMGGGPDEGHRVGGSIGDGGGERDPSAATSVSDTHARAAAAHICQPMVWPDHPLPTHGVSWPLKRVEESDGKKKATVNRRRLGGAPAAAGSGGGSGSDSGGDQGGSTTTTDKHANAAPQPSTPTTTTTTSTTTTSNKNNGGGSKRIKGGGSKRIKATHHICNHAGLGGGYNSRLDDEPSASAYSVSDYVNCVAIHPLKLRHNREYALWRMMGEDDRRRVGGGGGSGSMSDGVGGGGVASPPTAISAVPVASWPPPPPPPPPTTLPSFPLPPPPLPHTCRAYIGILCRPDDIIARQTARLTWASAASALHMRVRFYIAEGGHTSSISAPEEDVVRVKGKDSYERLVHKTMAILRDGAESGCAWVIKTDIDTYIRPLFLAEHLDALDARAASGKRGTGGGGGGGGGDGGTTTTTTTAAPATGGGGGAAGGVSMDQGAKTPTPTTNTATPHGPLTLVGHIWGHSRAHYTGVWEMDKRFYTHAHYPPYAGGPLYGLSHTLAQAVARYLNTHPVAVVPEYGPEDATVGVLVKRAVAWMDEKGLWGVEEGGRRSEDGAPGVGSPTASSSSSASALPSAAVVVDTRVAVSPPPPPSSSSSSSFSSPSSPPPTTTSSIEYLNLWPFNPTKCDSRVVAVNPINSATPTNFWALHAYELESPNGLCDVYRFGMHYGRTYPVSVDLHDPGVVGDGAGRLKTESLPWEIAPAVDGGDGGGGKAGSNVIKGREHLLLSPRALQQTHHLSSFSSVLDATHASLTHLFTHTHAHRPHTTHTDVSSHWSVASSSNDTHTLVLGVRVSGTTIASLHRATRARPEVDVVVVMPGDVVCGCIHHDGGGGGGSGDGNGGGGPADSGVAVEALETFLDALPWEKRMRVIVTRRACDARIQSETPTLADTHTGAPSQTQIGTGAAEAYAHADGHAQTQADAAKEMQRALDAALRAVVGRCGGNRCVEVVVRSGSSGGGGSTQTPATTTSTTTATAATTHRESSTHPTHPLSLLESVKPLLRREALVVVVDVRTRLTHTHLHHALAHAVKGRGFYAGMPLPPARLSAPAAADGRPSGSSSSLSSSTGPLTRGGKDGGVGGGDAGRAAADAKHGTAERTATERRLRRGGGSGSGDTGAPASKTHTASERHTHTHGCVDSSEGGTQPPLLSQGLTHFAAHARDFVRVSYDPQVGSEPQIVDRILSGGYHLVRAYEDGEGGGR